jgi:hypothetical protein
MDTEPELTMQQQMASRIATGPAEDGVSRVCGPEGCEANWLVSDRVSVDSDIVAFTDKALELGWGDGLPLVPATEERVADFLINGSREWFPDQIVAHLPPSMVECTVEKIAINAVMAGAPAASLPLLIASLKAMCDPCFDLGGLTATTGSVVPAIFVNGPIRNRLDIPYQAGCLGGVAGAAPAIGRALRLILRNVGGQKIDDTSYSVFGQPGRVAGIVVGEWEEKSPWAPLAERRGVFGDAVTVYGTMGTDNIVDTMADTGPLFLKTIGRSLATPGANGFLASIPIGETAVAINPVWASIIARDVPSIEDVQELIWRHASHHISTWDPVYRRALEEQSRVDSQGLVHLVPSPADVIVFVAGGLGSLHAAGFRSWGTCMSVTRPVGA